jgi:hypothetical protein
MEPSLVLLALHVSAWHCVALPAMWLPAACALDAAVHGFVSFQNAESNDLSAALRAGLGEASRGFASNLVALSRSA